MGIFLDYVTLISAALAILLILLQTRGASLGAGFGGEGDSGGGSVRRGSELSVHRLTIGLVIVFALSLVTSFFFT